MVYAAGSRMKKSYIKYLISLLLFGANGIVASFIDMNSYEIVFFRTLLGSFLLLLIFLAGRGKFTFYKYKRQFFCLAISGISMGASWMLLYEAYTKIGVSIASLLYYCGPMIVMALSPLLFKEKLTVCKAVGFLTVLCGVFLINGTSIHTQSNASAFNQFCNSSCIYSVETRLYKEHNYCKYLTDCYTWSHQHRHWMLPLLFINQLSPGSKRCYLRIFRTIIRSAVFGCFSKGSNADTASRWRCIDIRWGCCWRVL